MEDDLTRTLQHIGLKPLASRVYLKLLEYGQATAYELANDLKVSRPLVYSAIDELIEESLATRDIKDYGSKVYPAEPEKVLQIARRQQREARRLELKVEELLPALKQRAGGGAPKPEIEMLFDIEGIRGVYERSIDEAKEIYSIISSESIVRLLGKEWLDGYMKRRTSRGVSIKMIDEDPGPGPKPFPTDKELLRETRYIARGEVYNMQVLFYAPNTVLIISADKEKFGMLIKSEYLFKTMLGIFNMMWSNLPFSRPYIL